MGINQQSDEQDGADVRIVIAGGNGFIGRHLSTLLTQRGDEVIWLVRRPGRGGNEAVRAEEYAFDPVGSPDDTGWQQAVDGADAIVNLAGAPIASRWNARVKQELRDSRLLTARALIRAMAKVPTERRPDVYVSASGIGIYGDRGAEALDESSPVGTDWLALLAVDWENVALGARDAGARTVIVRTSVVLGEEGFLPKMLTPMKLFAGGPVGSGKQWFPWIHVDDIAAVYAHAIDTPGLKGPLIAAAPEQLTMAQFAKALGRVLHRPSWFPVPGFVLRVILGEVAPYTLFSQRVKPAALVASGFEFSHPRIDEALENLTR